MTPRSRSENGEHVSSADHTDKQNKCTILKFVVRDKIVYYRCTRCAISLGRLGLPLPRRKPANVGICRLVIRGPLMLTALMSCDPCVRADLEILENLITRQVEWRNFSAFPANHLNPDGKRSHPTRILSCLLSRTYRCVDVSAW